MIIIILIITMCMRCVCVWSDHSHIAGAEWYTRGAGAGQEPPRCPSASVQAPARPARSSAAPPALPFALQPSAPIGGSGISSEHTANHKTRNQKPPSLPSLPPKDPRTNGANVVVFGTDGERLFPDTRRGGSRRAAPERVGVGAHVGRERTDRDRETERGFNWFRKPQGRF